MSDDSRATVAAKPRSPRPMFPACRTTAKSRGYEALDSRDNQQRHRLNICPKGGTLHAPGYSFIIDICYDEDEHTGILLVMNTMLIKVRSHNLKPIIDLLMLGTCQFTQEFRDDKLDKPDDAAAPFVNSVSIVASSKTQDEEDQLGKTS